MAGYRKLGRTSSQRKALLRNQVTNLLYHGKIVTTEAKAKETAEAIRSFSWRYCKGSQPESERNRFQPSGFQGISLCADGNHPFQSTYLRSGACGRAGDHHPVHAAYRCRKDPHVKSGQHFHRDQSSGKNRGRSSCRAGQISG